MHEQQSLGFLFVVPPSCF